MLASQTPTDRINLIVALDAVSASSNIGARRRIENSDASSTLGPRSPHEERDSCATDEVAVADSVAKRFLNWRLGPTDRGARPRWEVAPLPGFGCAHVGVDDVPVWVVLDAIEERWTRGRAANTQPIPTRSNPWHKVSTTSRSSPNPDESAVVHARLGSLRHEP
jgi:hypothetical protein